MKTIIPSTTLKAKYLRNLPIQTCYLDSNGHKYRVEERLVRGCLSKFGVAYFGENECKVLEDIPIDMLKVSNPKRGNIMLTMKSKLTKLELPNRELVSELEFGKALEQVKVLFGNEEYLETETEFYHISNECLIYSLKKNDVGNSNDLKQHFDDLTDNTCEIFLLDCLTSVIPVL